MRKFFGCLLIFFSTVLPCQAADTPKPEPAKVTATTAEVKLPADREVKYDEGFITIKADSPGPVKWLILNNQRVKYVSVDDLTIILSVPPVNTTITVMAVSFVDGKFTEYATMKITVTGAPSQQPTKPTNSTGDDTQPSKPKLYVTFVIDEKTTTADQARILNSQTLRSSIQNAGYALKIYDINKNAELLADRKLTSYINNAGPTPVLLIQRVLPNGKGHVEFSKTMPLSEQEILNTINQIAAKS